MHNPHLKIQFVLLTLLLIAAILIDIFVGSVHIPPDELFQALLGKSSHENWVYILHHIRLPRILTAILTGAGLSAAGLMMQTLFRNPLAGPYVLGISSGASLGVAVLILSTGVINLSIEWVVLSFWGQAIAAVLGALLVFFLILFVAGRIRDSVSLLIVGIMFGSMSTALVSILQYFSQPEQVQRFVIWTMGSLSSTSWSQLMVLSPFVGAGIILTVVLIKPMNALLIGEQNAQAAGVNVLHTRYLILIGSSLLTGAITAFTGPIAFIGLAVPHLIRMLFGTTNHRVVVPGALLGGALLLLICDIISQVPGTSLVLPINAITALFGAPVVIYIIIGRKKLKAIF